MPCLSKARRKRKTATCKQQYVTNLDQLTHVLAAGWRQFLEALHPDDWQTLLRVLREEYSEEGHAVAQFTRHAQRMPYPQFRARLLRGAE